MKELSKLEHIGTWEERLPVEGACLLFLLLWVSTYTLILPVFLPALPSGELRAGRLLQVVSLMGGPWKCFQTPQQGTDPVPSTPSRGPTHGGKARICLSCFQQSPAVSLSRLTLAQGHRGANCISDEGLPGRTVLINASKGQSRMERQVVKLSRAGLSEHRG